MALIIRDIADVTESIPIQPQYRQCTAPVKRMRLLTAFHNTIVQIATALSDKIEYSLSRRRTNRIDREWPFMRFGYFDDARREYVITTPRTPYPWINYLGSENFFSLVSHRAGGYCFYRDARLRRLMRYRYNNVPTDVGGRYFYINDGGEVWNPSFAPTNTALDAFE